MLCIVHKTHCHQTNEKRSEHNASKGKSEGTVQWKDERVEKGGMTCYSFSSVFSVFLL